MIRVAIAAMTLLATPAFAACGPTDFSVVGFRFAVTNSCAPGSCQAFRFTGQIQNNCAAPAGADLKVTAFDKDGLVVSTVEGWPASIRNIAPGSSYAFDLGPLMTFDPSVTRASIDIIDARTW